MSEEADYYIAVQQTGFPKIVAELGNHTESEAKKILDRFGDSAVLLKVIEKE